MKTRVFFSFCGLVILVALIDTAVHGHWFDALKLTVMLATMPTLYLAARL